MTNIDSPPQHIWRLDQQKTIASAHLVVSDPDLTGFMARARVALRCLHDYGIHSVTLQPELVAPLVPHSPTAAERPSTDPPICDLESQGLNPSQGESAGGTTGARTVDGHDGEQNHGAVPPATTSECQCQIKCPAKEGRCEVLLCCGSRS